MTAPEESETERPHMVGHIHLKVRDVERAIDFYTDILGLDIEERHGRYAFLTFGGRHHDVALQSALSQSRRSTTASAKHSTSTTRTETGWKCTSIRVPKTSKTSGMERIGRSTRDRGENG
jgi:catechol-2,3-dioxygenase